MANLDTIVVGASAGGVEALSKVVSSLPGDLPAAILVVVHFPETSMSMLPSILSRAGALCARHGEDGELIEPSRIYVAPTGRHMLVKGDRIRLTLGPKENGNRPAIDPLFRSAAHARSTRVLSVLLSGLLDDGTLGTAAVKNRGGTTMAQDPDEALFGDMPRNAIQHVGAHYVLSLDGIAAKITEMAGAPVPDGSTTDSSYMDPASMNTEQFEDLESRGRPSPFVCPECNGTLYELTEEGVRHYRCRVGHSYLAESLATSQATCVETALWTALRAVKEHNALLSHMMDHAMDRGFKRTEKTYREKLAEGDRRLRLIEEVLYMSPSERDLTSETLFPSKPGKSSK